MGVKEVLLNSTILTSLGSIISTKLSKEPSDLNSTLSACHFEILRSVCSKHPLLCPLGDTLLRDFLMKEAKIQIFSDKDLVESGNSQFLDLYIVIHGHVLGLVPKTDQITACYPPGTYLTPMTPFHSLIRHIEYKAHGTTIVGVISKNMLKQYLTLTNNSTLYGVLQRMAVNQLQIYKSIIHLEHESVRQKASKVISRNPGIAKLVTSSMEKVELNQNQYLADGYINGSWLYFVCYGTLELSFDGLVLAYIDSSSLIHELNEYITINRGNLNIRCVSPSALIFKIEEAKILASTMSKVIDAKLACSVLIPEYFQAEFKALKIGKRMPVVSSRASNDDLNKMTEYAVFYGLDEAALSYIVESSEVATLTKNDYIFLVEDHVDFIYLILDGVVSLYNSQKKIISELSIGAYFGEDAVFEQINRLSSAKVSSETARLLRISRSVMKEIFAKYGAIEYACYTKFISKFPSADELFETNSMAFDSIKGYLSNVKMLKYLSDEDLEEIYPFVSVRTFGPGSLIYTEAPHNSTGVFVVLRGRVRVVDARGTIVKFIRQDLFGGRADESEAAIPLQYISDVSSQLLFLKKNALDYLKANSQETFSHIASFCRLGIKNPVLMVLKEALEVRTDNLIKHLVPYCELETYSEGQEILDGFKQTKDILIYIVEGSVKASGAPLEPTLLITSKKWIGWLKVAKSHRLFVAHHQVRTLVFNAEAILLLGKYLPKSLQALSLVISKFKKSYGNSVSIPSKCADIDALPTIVFFHILYKLPFKDRLNMKLVCSKWNQLIRFRTGMESINLNDNRYAFEKFMFLVAASNVKLRKFEARGAPANISQLKVLVKTCQNITDIDLSFCKDSDPWIILHGLQYVKTAKFNHLFLNETLCEDIKCSSLVSLSLRSISYKNANALDPFFTKLSSLVELRVMKGEHYTSTEFFKSVAINLTELQVLSIEKSSNVSEGAFKFIANGSPNLKHLNIATTVSITDSAMYELSLGPQSWEYLDFSNCVNITDCAIMFFSRGIRNLRVLKVNHLNCLTDAFISYVADTCLRLEHLSIYSCPKITHNHCRQVLSPFVTVEMSPDNPSSNSSKPKALEISVKDRYTVHEKSTKVIKSTRLVESSSNE